MITPRFTVRQDGEYVIVEMKVPGHVKLGEDDIWIEGHSFKFHAHPYFLSLEMPGEVTQDGKERAEFDREHDKLTVWVPKKQHGEHFEGLDMLTRLMTPTGTAAATTTAKRAERAGIELIDPSPQPIQGDESDLTSVAASASASVELGIARPKYGFCDAFQGFFEPLVEDMPEIVDIEDPDNTPATERTALREAHEDEKFDPDHYMADFVQDTEVRAAIEFRPKWIAEREAIEKGPCSPSSAAAPAVPPVDMSAVTPASLVEMQQRHASAVIDELRKGAITFTPEMEESLTKLPRREYIMSDDAQAVSALVGILFSYCYDHRTTSGESTVESAWTICKLSPTLSWLDTPATVPGTLLACVHRALAFPLFRHWRLVVEVLHDVCCVLGLGRRAVLRSLLEVRAVLGKHEYRHYVNTLYIDDYCVWIQGVGEERIQRLAKEVCEWTARLKQSMVRWPLSEFEQIAMEEGPEPAHGEDESQQKSML